MAINDPNAIERFDLLKVGWRRRSALFLDAAGCPPWLIKRRCPEPDWGALTKLFQEECSAIDNGDGSFTYDIG